MKIHIFYIFLCELSWAEMLLHSFHLWHSLLKEALLLLLLIRTYVVCSIRYFRYETIFLNAWWKHVAWAELKRASNLFFCEEMSTLEASNCQFKFKFDICKYVPTTYMEERKTIVVATISHDLDE